MLSSAYIELADKITNLVTLPFTLLTISRHCTMNSNQQKHQKQLHNDLKRLYRIVSTRRIENK